LKPSKHISQQQTGGLTAQVGWLGLKVGGRLALPCIRQMNQVYGTLEILESVCASYYGAIEIVLVIIGYYHYYYYY